MPEELSPEAAAERWSLACRVVWTVVAVLALLCVAAPLTAGYLNAWTWLGLPVGYLTVGFAVPVLCMLLAFWDSGRQAVLDRHFDAAED